MPFYYDGECVGDDSREVHFDMSDEDRQAVIYDYIMEAYALDDIADRMSTGDLVTDRNILTIRALDYIMKHSRNGRGPDFGGYTWSDEDADESDKSAAPVRTAPAKKPAKKPATKKPKADAKPAKAQSKNGTSYDVTDGRKTYGTFSSQAKAEAMKRELKAEGVNARVRVTYAASAQRRR